MEVGRRISIVLLSILAVVLFLVVVVVFVISATDWGREQVRRVAVGQLEAAINGEVEIARLEGDLLSEVRMIDVTIVDAEHRPFFDADTIETEYSLLGLLSKKIQLSDLDLVGANIVLDQPPGEDWNFDRIFASDAPADTTTTGWGEWIELRDVALENSRITVRQAWEPSPGLSSGAEREAVRRALAGDTRSVVIEVPGGFQEVMDFRDLNAELAKALIAHPDTTGIPVDIEHLSGVAQIFGPPPADVRDLTGRVIIRGDSLHFQNIDGVLPDSRLALDGVYATEHGELALDFQGAPAAFADLRWLYPNLPDQGGGTLEGSFEMDSVARRIRVRDMDLRVGQSELRGHADVRFGDAVRLQNTDLQLEQFDTRLIEDMVPSVTIPRHGRLGGRLALEGAPSDMQLNGDLTFADEAGGLSRVTADGRVSMDADVEFRRLDVQMQPLQADLVRAFAPDLPVRGTIEGRASLNGSLADRMQIESNLVMQDPQTGISRVAAEGGLIFGDAVSLDDWRMHLDPLQLDLVRPYVAGVPPGATASGPVVLDGSFDGLLHVEGDVTFTDPESGVSEIATQGAIDLQGDGLRFQDFRLQFHPLRVELVRSVYPDLPLGGTLEGSAALTGSPSSRLEIDGDIVHVEGSERSHVTGGGQVATGPEGVVDLSVQLQPLSLQIAGQFAPQLGLRGQAEGNLDASGSLEDLRIDADLGFGDGGSLEFVGQFDLASSETAYDFKVDLAEFNPAAISERVPYSSSLQGTAQADGRGFDPATMRAELHVDFEGVEIEEYEADEVLVQLAVADGIATVETTRLQLRSAEAEIQGTFGLVAGREGALSYSVAADSLETMSPWIPAADTGEVMLRPAVVEEQNREAERIARAAQVEYLATGRLPDQEEDRTAPAFTFISRDSLSGSVQASGTIRGNVESFDADGYAVADDVVFRGHYLESGEIDYALSDVGSDTVDVSVDGSFGSMLVEGYAFDSAAVKATYHGGRFGSGAAEIAIDQDEATDLRMDVEFALALERNELRLLDMALQFDTVAWNATEPATIYWGGDGVEVEDLDLRSEADEHIYVDGDLPIEGSLDLEIVVGDVEIRHVYNLLQEDQQVSGRVSLDAVVQGTADAPELRGDAMLVDAAFDNEPVPDVHAVFEYLNEELQATADLMQDGVEIAAAEARIPMDLTFGNGAPRVLDRPLRIDIQADRLPLDALPAFTNQVQAAEGTIALDLSVTGTPGDPSIEGNTSLALDAFEFAALGIRFEPIRGYATAAGDVIEIDSLVAWSDGPVRMTGEVDVESLTAPIFNLEVEARDTWVIDTEDARLQVDADLAIDGPFDALEVTGQVRTLQGVIYVPELSGFGPVDVVDLEDPATFERVDTLLAMQREIVTERSPLVENLQADVEVEIDRDVWLRSTEANVEIYTPSETGPLRIGLTGLQETPTIEGTINTDRGEYEYLSRRFTLTRGAVNFLGGEEIDPLFQVAAEHEVQLPGREALTIRIVLGGSMRDPEVTLESDAQPPISESDLLSFLAFGREASTLIQGGGSSLSGQASGGMGLVGNVAGLASQQFTAIALESLVSGIEADVGRELGLDVIRITPARLPPEVFTAGYLDVLRGTEIEVGSYLGPRLFVGAQARATQAYPGVRFEFRTRRDFEWSASWRPRYVPTVPTLREPEANRAAVLSSFLFKEWRF